MVHPREHNLTATPSPAELGKLEEELAGAELALATLHAEIEAFEIQYVSAVGPLHAERDRIAAEIAGLLRLLYPADHHYERREQEARRRAQESEAAAARPTRQQAFQPTEELKRLFRKLAKLIHPDLADGSGDRARREELMKRANRAYSDGDEKALSDMLLECQQPESALSTAAKWNRRQKIEARLAAIRSELAGLEASESCKLMQAVREAALQGRELLREMAQHLVLQIEDMRAQLTGLREQWQKR